MKQSDSNESIYTRRGFISLETMNAARTALNVVAIVGVLVGKVDMVFPGNIRFLVLSPAKNNH